MRPFPWLQSFVIACLLSVLSNFSGDLQVGEQHLQTAVHSVLCPLPSLPLGAAASPFMNKWEKQSPNLSPPTP